jgi:AcrR family transcriptional regulator
MADSDQRPADDGRGRAHDQDTDRQGDRAGRRGRQSRAETTERILAAAQRLFYWDGIRASGIDRVAAAAGVAPVTLYRSFATKDALVEAYVRANATGYRQWLTEATRPSAGSARDRILAMFDALQEQVAPENCRGCPFLMALAEFPEAEHPARRHAIDLKAWVRDHIRALAREHAAERAVRDPDALGDQLVLVFEGVYASVQALGAAGPAAQARAAAEALVVAASAT